MPEWNRNSYPWILALFAGPIAIGCSGDSLAPHLSFGTRPQIELTVAPAPSDSVSYLVQFEWTSFDPDGRVSHHLYAVNPPMSGDTTWTRVDGNQLTLKFPTRTPVRPDALPPPTLAADAQIFVIQAVDNDGLHSPTVFRAFTSTNVLPQTQILQPAPSRLTSQSTPVDVTITWEGFDADDSGPGIPVGYRYVVVARSQIQDSLGLGNFIPSPDTLQYYFSGFAPEFDGWSATPRDSMSARLTGLSEGVGHYFAVAAVDEAGGAEPQFLLDSNLLQFIPLKNLLGPWITVSNPYFTERAPTAVWTVDEDLLIPSPVPMTEQTEYWWTAESLVQGAAVEAYRWIFGPPGLVLTNEEPRESPDQIDRWSEWSIDETSAVVGPFEFEAPMRLYIEAVDTYGTRSIVGIEVQPFDPEPTS